ncbi:hypothetical protein BJV78DRAFT_1280830 [Lactifluus subvellereus]|nr:hypothetical protein BJV78DRAFT_1280830 [Lactifluus subvellereus]
MRVSAPRLGQLVHLLSVKPVSIFSRKNILAVLRHRRDSFGARAVMHLPNIIDCDVDSKFDTETAPDDSTLVESRQLSTLSDEADSILLNDVPEDDISTKTKCTTTSGPLTSSELPSKPQRLSIIYPLPTAENLLTQEPTQMHTVADPPSIAPPLCIPGPLSPPPTHYKRRRARIISGEDHDPDLDRSPIRSNIDPDSTPRFPF